MSGLWTLFPAYSFGEFRCAARQRTQSPGKFRRWIFLFALVSLIRVGEASNPGPSVHFDAHSFTLGTCNPSGLRNKAHYFQTHMSYGDLWTVAETHFFGKDVSRFRAGLCAAKSAHRYCITDRQATRKNLVSQTAWKGVAILAKHPTRAIPSNVPSHILDSGRALSLRLHFLEMHGCLVLWSMESQTHTFIPGICAIMSTSCTMLPHMSATFARAPDFWRVIGMCPWEVCRCLIYFQGLDFVTSKRLP